MGNYDQDSADKEEVYSHLCSAYAKGKSYEHLYEIKQAESDRIFHEINAVLLDLGRDVLRSVSDITAPFPINQYAAKGIADANNTSEIISAVDRTVTAMSALGAGSKMLHEPRSSYPQGSAPEAEEKERILAFFRMNNALAEGEVDADTVLDFLSNPESSEAATQMTGSTIASSEFNKVITKAMQLGIDAATPALIKKVAEYVFNVSTTIPLPPLNKMTDAHCIILNKSPYTFEFINDNTKHGKGLSLVNSIPGAIASYPWLADGKEEETYFSTGYICCSKRDSALIGVEYGVQFKSEEIETTFNLGISVPLMSGHNKVLVNLDGDVSATEISEDIEKHGSDKSMYNSNEYVSVEARISSGSGGEPRVVVIIEAVES
ncbi:hypothetical protein CHH28_16725 [Bacterioplanes sanyensis]|uniref:Uncharacterized protein n=1 Tax=Bacterioplanes sanyensis TaxID=1249553 RepID=A0A222FN87_9GAMM|nr:hypothetical protein [Bacterioplanes sanyensis]ASP40219.1 hypothetical protein CHH28_16725 [Bacterioplanes sanyensis]